ncbi:hypothetical protein RB195_016636 [Necator americanus]|uniref:MT-A70 protein n=1 Tax=Necator americanus TaxID=51031 RepID=A0ABR1C548_NECAM
MGFVISSSDTYDIVDERAYYNDLYEGLGVMLNESLFLINGPFLMDSQFEAMKREGRRIRKRKKPSTTMNETSEEVAAIEKISREIREVGQRSGYFCSQLIHDNNRVAKAAAHEVVNRSIVFYRPKTISSAEITILEDNSDFIVDREYCMLNSWYRNSSDSCIRLNVSKSEGERSSTYYMPPRSTFHIGAVSDLKNFAALNGETFDLMVMDPPWDNLSVKRQRSYVVSDTAISSIDMECLASDGLVAIWVTNRKGIDQDLDVHLQRWGLQSITAFFWLKVTKEGDPVCSFNASHKLPYEKLVLACRTEAASIYESISSANGNVFASVPMALPSRKPPVVPILKRYGICPTRCVELFARCLQPNTVSIGFESLLLQSSACFVPMEMKDVVNSSTAE